MTDALTRRLRAAVTTDPPLWTRPFLLVCGVNLLAYSSYAAVHPTFAAYLGTVTASESLVGITFGAFTFAAMLARPATGWLLDRTGRRAVQAVAIVALAAATLSFGLTAAILGIVLLRAAHGVAWGVTSTTTPTIAADVVPAERRSEGFGYFGILPNVALVVVPPLSLAVAHAYGFGLQFAGAAALALLALGPLGLLDETGPPADGDEGLYAPEAVPAALLLVLASAPLGAVDALVPLYAATVGLGNAGLFFTVMGAGIIAARSLLGRLPASNPLVLPSALALQAAGLAVLAAVPRLLVYRGLPLGLLAGAALFGVGFAPVFPLLQSAAVSATDGDNGSVTATLLVGMDLGVGGGAVVAGVVADGAGFPAAYTAAVAFSLVSLLLAVALGGTPER